MATPELADVGGFHPDGAWGGQHPARVFEVVETDLASGTSFVHGDRTPTPAVAEGSSTRAL